MDSDYSVKIDDVVIAKEMSLENAVILVKALFEEWFMKSSLSITIVKEERIKKEVTNDR
jgi:hypothetical protein